jgi:glycine cleavage system H protein
MSSGSLVPEGLLYTATHEWVKVDGNMATIGITDHAQSELTDVVFVDLPPVGKVIEGKDVLVVLESVKTVAEVYAPVGGKVVKINEDVKKSPELVNKDPYGKGWLVAIEMESAPANLMTPDKYKVSLSSK